MTILNMLEKNGFEIYYYRCSDEFNKHNYKLAIEGGLKISEIDRKFDFSHYFKNGEVYGWLNADDKTVLINARLISYDEFIKYLNLDEK